MPEFTQDWFSHNITGLKEVMARLPAKKHFLEIGCFEGLATCWFLAHHLDNDGTMACIDTFEGGLDHVVTKFEGVRERFLANVEEVKRPNQELIVHDCPSYKGLARLISEDRAFDFAYIDGSHTAADVMTDACMAFHLLKVGGIMVFDDYLWGNEKPLLETPKLAVDLFTSLFRDKVAILMLGYQLSLKRVS